MPEGDTIFRMARALDRALRGKPVTRFESGFARLVRENDNAPLTGCVIERVEARGKWVMMWFSDGRILLTHMLMNGIWHIYRHKERWKRPHRDMRIMIENADWVAVGFTVPVAEFHTEATLARKPGVARLGPDLLSPEFDRAAALANIHAHGSDELGVVLMTQSVLAGIGNVFKSEICFVCGVNPFCHVDRLSLAKLGQIVDTAHRLLRANVSEEMDSGARRTRSGLNRRERLWVYERPGAPCHRCGTPIRMYKQGTEARVTYWCSQCQPLPE